jgi:hypothetical protein
MVMAARMMKLLSVSNIGKAMNAQKMPRKAPAAYIGRRPTLSVARPTSGTQIAWITWAISSRSRIRLVSTSRWVDR